MRSCTAFSMDLYLSLCNSDQNRDVGFTWLNRDGDEFFYENRFEEVHLREVLYLNSPDEMEVEAGMPCQVFSTCFSLHL